MQFAVLNIGDLWGALWHKLRERVTWDGFDITGIYEEDNQKFVLLKDHDEKLYRLDFSYTEADGLVLSETIVEVKESFTKTRNVYKFADPDFLAFAEIEGRRAYGEVIRQVQGHEGKGAYVESVYDDHIIYTKDDTRYRVDAKVKVGADDKDVEVKIDWDSVKKDADQKMAEIQELKAQLEERNNIIMDYEAKIADLEQFRDACLERDRAAKVSATMESVKKMMDKDTFAKCQEEGMACAFEELDAWANKVKASVVDKLVAGDTGDIMRFAAPIETNPKNGSVWNRL